MKNAFVPLDELCWLWAEQSGQPFASVLSSLCGHVAKGHFPVHCFMHRSTGHYLGSGAFTQFPELIVSDDVPVQRDAFAALSEILVSTSELLEFCKATSTRPPVRVTGDQGRLRWLDTKHLAPPSIQRVDSTIKTAETTPPVGQITQRRGRKKGSGSLAAKDLPLLKEMDRLITDGAESSPWAAALKLTDKAAGAGTAESKTKRLHTRYRRWKGKNEA